MPPGDWLSLRRTASYGFNMVFYRKDIERLKDIELTDGYLATYYKGEELFIKSLYIDNQVVAFIYYKEGGDSFYVELLGLNYKGTAKKIESKISESSRIPSTQPFKIDDSLNDFVKVNNKRLAFIYTSSSDICILLIIINNNKNIIFFDYYIDFDVYKPTKQISGFSYNDFLMLSVTTMNGSEYVSFLIIFGYPKELDMSNASTKVPSTQVDIPKVPSTQVDIPKVSSTQVATTKENPTQVPSTKDISSPIESTKEIFIQCDNFDNENEDNYEKIKYCEYISKYKGGSPIIIKESNGYSLQITTYKNELKILKEGVPGDSSVIDLKDCADLLREQNDLSPDDDLIIIKYENDNIVSNGNEKNVQYEVYLPNSNIKLDLSVCSETDIDIYIPIELDEKTQRLYDNLKKQGYNLFDKNDDFYLKFCTIYNSLNGTDVILPDRHNIYQRHKLECQNNCEYSDYLSESKYLKCKCGVTNEEKIETKDPEKITGKSVSRKFYDVLKYSNYKVLYCYNLVFRKVTIKENLGSILSNIYFIGYLIAIGILFYTKAAYLKIEIEKLLRDENIDNNNLDINNKNIVVFKKNDIIDEEKIEKEKVENIEKITIQKKEEEDINKKVNEAVNKLNNNIKKGDNGQGNRKKSQKSSGSRNQSTIQLKDTTLKNSISENKKLANKEVLSNKLAILDEKSNDVIIKNSSERKINSKKESKISEKEGEKEEQKETLSNYELNNLEYAEALELDKRNFLKIYWYLLKREHIALFTFINWNDFNLFCIKLSKLFLAICSDMAFNVFFFSDESMHKTYETGGEHDWLGHLAQIVIATIISQILQVFVNFLTMTDIHYYELKALKRENKINSKEAVSVIKCIKIKIIAYIISTFLIFLFFWYASSAFCAVYPNTQRIFIVDSYSSFLMGLLYPFILYLFPTALRVISLKAKKTKNLKIIYSLSDKIPIF